MKKQRVALEEKPVFARGRISEGNWFVGQAMASSKEPSGTLEMPLSLLPVVLQRRAQKGQEIHIRLLISEDGEKRVK